MIINALNHYYDILSKDPNIDISPRYYCKIGIRYALNIDGEGKLINIIPLIQEKTIKGKGGKEKTIVEIRKFIVPEQGKKASNILPFFLCGTSDYVLGLSNKDDHVRVIKCHDAFKELNIGLLNNAYNEISRAVINFLNNWHTDQGMEDHLIKELGDNLFNCNLCFIFNGKFVHEDPEIKRSWERYNSEKENELFGVCSITGERKPLARLHPSIKNVRGAQPSGASIVSFNLEAFKYGNKQQGENAPISEEVAFKYTTALNYLLASDKQKMVIGDVTTVFWAESTNDFYYNLVNIALRGAGEDREMENDIRQFFQNVKEGKPSNLENISDSVKFYILGLSPNASRLSIRYFYQGTFGHFVANILNHYEDMGLLVTNESNGKIYTRPYDRNKDYIPIWKLLKETAAPSSKNEVASPLLAGSVIQAIISGGEYPALLYNSIMNRIRADRDINYVRASIIKGYLLRKSRLLNNKYKEELSMSLNVQSNETAYLLGRLFAVIENAQAKASGGNLNSTLKDRFFSSACATPSVVFPALLKLAQTYFSKGNLGFQEHLTQDIIGAFKDERFPNSLSLEEQGIFIIGYYHQRASLYISIKKENKGEGEKENEAA